MGDEGSLLNPMEAKQWAEFSKGRSSAHDGPIWQYRVRTIESQLQKPRLTIVVMVPDLASLCTTEEGVVRQFDIGRKREGLN